jgi:hypothetical protein
VWAFKYDFSSANSLFEEFCVPPVVVMWIPSLPDLLSYMPVVPELPTPTPYPCQEIPEANRQVKEWGVDVYFRPFM